MHRSLVIKIFTIVSLLISTTVTALTMGDFIAICESNEKNCTEQPMLNAYVGGSLDLIAVLHEETDYLDTIYCKDPRELFNVEAIIQFMELHQDDYNDRNAMLLVIRYLEENSGC